MVMKGVPIKLSVKTIVIPLVIGKSNEVHTSFPV